MRGWGELALCAAVIGACWTRTPLGAIGQNAWVFARGGDSVDVLASFRTGLSDSLAEALESALVQGPLPSEAPVGAVPTTWTPAIRAAVAARLGEDALASLDASASADPDADPAVLLERLAVGPELTERATGRARAAGEARPDAPAVHRRFLPAKAARVSEREVDDVLALSTALDLAWPVSLSARVSSPFGYRHHPVLEKRKFHEGVDLAVPTGTPVFAAAPGKVVRAKADAVNGQYVKLDHGHGVTTSYCHGSAMHVGRGAQVAQGEHVMDSGSTGRSTGPHLHFGLRIKGRPVDPAPFRVVAAADRGPGTRAVRSDPTLDLPSAGKVSKPAEASKPLEGAVHSEPGAPSVPAPNRLRVEPRVQQDPAVVIAEVPATPPAPAGEGSLPDPGTPDVIAEVAARSGVVAEVPTADAMPAVGGMPAREGGPAR